MLDTLVAALEWLHWGVVPIPLLPRSKKPAIPWRRLQVYKPPEPLVVRWFDDTENNLGVMCGQISGGLVILDFDKLPAWHRWCRDNPHLGDTYTVKTGRGYHAYVNLTEVPERSMGMDGGDVKASGYVVAPPSIHPTGTPYRALDVGAAIRHADTIDDLGLVGVVEQTGWSEPGAVLPGGSGGGGTTIDDIKSIIPISVYLGSITRVVPSSPDGIWLMARCPLHDDHNPSMWVNTKRGVCGCFKPGCRGNGRSMDVINLHAKIRGIGLSRAIQELAAEAGL